jgi:hypothetical protein
MGKVDRKLFDAKYGSDPVAYFEHLPNVESVEVCPGEIRVNYKRDTKHIFPEEIMYGRRTENSGGRSVRIPFK